VLQYDRHDSSRISPQLSIEQWSQCSCNFSPFYFMQARALLLQWPLNTVKWLWEQNSSERRKLTLELNARKWSALRHDSLYPPVKELRHLLNLQCPNPRNKKAVSGRLNSCICVCRPCAYTLSRPPAVSAEPRTSMLGLRLHDGLLLLGGFLMLPCVLLCHKQERWSNRRTVLGFRFLEDGDNA
jgi:hypothetical protein